MDANSAQDRVPGGTVQPASRAAVAKQTLQAPRAAPERYELYDPFAEVTYRLKTIPEMVAKAEQLGATRFQAIDANGKRSQVDKIDGQWLRSDGRGLIEPAPAVSEPQRAGNTVPLADVATRIDSGAAAKRDIEAERGAQVRRLEAALNERYVIKRAGPKIGALTLGHTEYLFRGDTSRVAFTESAFRLATDNNSPSVARSMVDVAETRNWQALRVSGHEDFRRLVWLEASARGVKTLGYEPVPGDAELLRKEREARQVNRIEAVRGGPAAPDRAETTTTSARGNGGRKAVLAALDAVLVAKRVPEKQRVAVMTAAAEELARRQAAGETHKVKVLDKTAPSHRPVVGPAREVQRTRERASPAR